MPETSLVVKHRIVVEGVGREIEIEPNVEKMARSASPADHGDPRPDLERVLDALGRRYRRPLPSVALLQSLPGTLRGARYHVTSVVWDRTLIGGRARRHHPGPLRRRGGHRHHHRGALPLSPAHRARWWRRLRPQPPGPVRRRSRLPHQPGHLRGGRPGGRSITRSASSSTTSWAAPPATAGVPRRTRSTSSTVVGNTCMSHLFLGVSPQGLSALPFACRSAEGQSVPAAELGLHIHPGGTGLRAPQHRRLRRRRHGRGDRRERAGPGGRARAAVDIGTNGEIVVAQDGELYACSTAAGPAFEGARIRQGMRAATGAIDAVSIDGDVHYHVIGEAPPAGVCGSGLVDAVAGLVQAGRGGRDRADAGAGGIARPCRRR